jgi:predicted lipoprotein with Yx(FWY)xxD motif
MRYSKHAAVALVIVAFFAMVWGASPARAAATQGTSAAVHPAPSASASALVLARKIGNVTVLTNAKGFTLYRFALDTPTTSKCNGTCARYWPPLKGPVTAGPGVTGKIGTIKRSDGSTQATYDGHPLYTYIGDTRPGQDAGNNLHLSGGVWHVVPVSGMAAPAPSTATATPSLPRPGRTSARR